MAARRTGLRLALCSVVLACTDEATRDLTAPDAETAKRDGATFETQGVSPLAAGNTWVLRRRSPLPARQHAAAGTINGIIYVVGGTDGFGNFLANVDAYNVSTNTWLSRQPLPFARTGVNGASVIAGKLYVSGGAKPNCNPPCTTFLSNSLFVYDPGTNSWTKKAPMPVPGAVGAQGVINGRLYVYRGGPVVSPDSAFLRYNPITNSWVVLPSPPIHLLYPVAGVIDGKFYLVGGEGGGLLANAVLNVYTPATNTWATKAPMTTRRREHFGGVINGKLYVAGGIGDSDTSGVTSEVYEYDPVTNTWTERASMQSSQSSGASAVAGGKLFVIGGKGPGYRGLTRKVQVYIP